MSTEQEITDFLTAHRGNYVFKSPYHKNKKMLPFNIYGRSYDPSFPISVDTVSYRGWTKEDRQDSYNIDSLTGLINSGFLTKVA